ncbi:hypothetical protein GCM10011386_04610 [Parapedobacter defluvii]|uniref:DUF5000 domain-containing protein n=1 Tax=Parapedobacter defluvii TaxID=2045106 RepID=A0ABQ1L1Y3_9SPHI|nr:DUF4998 domain-containing protein [Parapedobacter defluvii]RQP08391.1 MAG: hypothetical protein EAS52_25225 [Parapedobacter sp.]GGC15872.1 hypothetical protein GCM10011386_04610 [Parapedobacter defluvii]
MMKNTLFVIFIGVILGFSSCDSETDIYEGYVVPNGLVYPGPAHTPVAHPGDNRIKISWLRGTDPRVQKARIFWNNYTDSVELPVAADVDTVSYIIDPISEGTYSFMIHTYDDEGNKSIPIEMMGAVYGDSYRSLLTNRLLKSTYYDGQDLKLNWGTAESSEVGIHLNWTDINGVSQTMDVDTLETETLIPNFNIDKPLSYSTTYKPDSLAIDVFQATTVETMIDPVVLIPQANWVEKPMPGDVGINGSYPLTNLWDGNTTNFMHSDDPATLPSTITWDLGLKTKLSRMKLWPRNNNDDRWNRGHPRVFEIYGSLEPNPDGSLDGSWTLLGKFECVQPSGNGTADPWQAPTSEDIALSDNGLEFEFVPGDSVNPDATVRYIRFRSIEHFNPTQPPRILLAEISFWGTLVK